MLVFEKKHPKARFSDLGMIPEFISDYDPRRAREQFDTNYSHGGGWGAFDGFTIVDDGASLHYPGDPPYPLLFETKLRDETIRFYSHAWVGIFQPDGSYEIARLD